MSIDKTESEQLSDGIKNQELSREIEIKQFIKKMKEKQKFNNEMLSYNMVINGRWGDGKTTFLKQIEEHIKNNKDLGIEYTNIIKISAWDYDFLDNPTEMILDIFDKNENKVIKKIWDVICSFSSNLSDEMAEQNIIWRIIKRTKDKTKEKNESETNNILNFNDLRRKIKKAINSDDGDVYIFIDDLDRCNPNFIIKLFEVLKHLFNIENVTIIYMLDFENINECIMNYYHLPIKPDVNENYLSKIIDYVHDLDEIDKTTYLLNKYYLNDFIILTDFINFSVNDNLNNILKMLKEKSFREQEKIIIKLLEIVEIIENEKNDNNLPYIDSTTIHFILFSFLEYWCNGNILNSNIISRKINNRNYYNTSLLKLMKEIIIIFENIYKDLDLDNFFNIIKNNNILYSKKNITLEEWNHNISKYLLKLIKFYS